MNKFNPLMNEFKSPLNKIKSTMKYINISAHHSYYLMQAAISTTGWVKIALQNIRAAM